MGERERSGKGTVKRVPVVDARGIPLMPTTPARARRMLKEGRAVARWNKLGIFYIQLKRAVDPVPKEVQEKTQPIAVSVDPGSSFAGLSVVGVQDTILNIMTEPVNWVKDALKRRREMRRLRRYRKCRRRKKRSDNRKRPEGWVPPSTKARWDTYLRIIDHLRRIIPITHVGLEEDKAGTKKGQKKWNNNFSPLQNGRRYFIKEVQRRGLSVTLLPAREVAELRKKYGLPKAKDKAEKSFYSHCVDAWVISAFITGAATPNCLDIWYMVPLRFHRRQLHRFQPSKRGIRKRYGGTRFLGYKRGTLVRHSIYGLCYIGGCNERRRRLSLHDIKTGKRITQDAKDEDIKILTSVSFRSFYIPAIPPQACGILAGVVV